MAFVAIKFIVPELCIAPPYVAVLEVKVLSAIVSALSPVAEFQIAPPSDALFNVKVEFLIPPTMLPLLFTAPPLLPEFEVNIIPSIPVTVPELYIAPPP